MIVRFDTPELAEKRFKELKKKHRKETIHQTDYSFTIMPSWDEGVKVIYCTFDESSIQVCIDGTYHMLTTAMKIVALMAEV